MRGKKKNTREGKNRTVVEKPKESNKECDSDAVESTDTQTRQRENKRGPKGKTDRGERPEEGEKRDTTRKETGRKTDDEDSNTKKKSDTESRKEKNSDPDTTDDKTVCEASSYTTDSKKRGKGKI